MLITTKPFVLALVLATPAFAGEWTMGPPLNMQRTHFDAAVAENGDIYVGGGGPTCGVIHDTVEVLRYDSVSRNYADHWEILPPMTTRRTDVCIVVANGSLYAIGGRNDEGVLASFECFDTLSSDPQWAILPATLNTARRGAAAVIDDYRRIWVVGGLDADGTLLASAEVFDPARSEQGWVLLDGTLNESRFACGAAADRLGRILVFGGQGVAGSHLASVERIDPHVENATWQFVASIEGPNSNNDRCTLGADGRVYLAGGWNPGYSDRVVRYDPEVDAWEPWFSLPSPRSNAVLVTGKDGSIFAIGGDDSGCPGLDRVEVLPGPCGAGAARIPLMDDDSSGTIDALDLLKLFASWYECP